MKVKTTDLVPPALATVAAVVAIAVWIQTGQRDLRLRKPGLDYVKNQPAPADPGDLKAPVPGEPSAGDGVPADIEGEWPGFRGLNRDGLTTEKVPLATSWPAEGPPILWSLEGLGEGYAGVAVSRGRVFLLDYDEDKEEDTLRCLSLEDGREIWRNGYPIELKKNHGVTRTIPVVVGDFVVTIGPRCQLACWDFETGKNHWLIDLVIDYGTSVPEWYTGQCPLIDGDRLIVAPAGKKTLMMAIDYRTGKILWETPNPRLWGMTHVSVVPMEFEGRRMYVYCSNGGITGVDAETGEQLWDSNVWPERFASSPSPVPVPGGRLFLSSGYRKDIGSLMLQIKKKGDTFTAETAFELTPKQYSCEQQTPVYRDGHLFGVSKRGGKAVCLDLKGNEVWNSGRDKFGDGPFLIAGNLFFGLHEHGTLTLAEIDNKSYKQLATCEPLGEAHEAWAPMALAGGRLILRDITRMVCLDVRQK